ncbi:MAG: hypothetical protein KF691_01065 [Phycisphaeraceae bacterium]|nr:hypothetical protein [Phycisphaeraceae bacterium]
MGTSGEQRSQGPMRVDFRAGESREGSVIDRRLGLDKRELAKAQGEEAPSTGLERRRGPGRRLSDFTKSAEEGEMTKEQFMFLAAIDAFKKGNGKTFPTWTDVLEVVRLLGYRKTCKSEINLRNAEDWMEAADAPSNTRPQRWAQREKIDRERAGKAA